MQSSKNGLLVGVELGLGGGSGTGKIDNTESNGIYSPISYTSFNISSFNLNGKIFTGYQRYFSQDNKMGYNAKVSLGTGYLDMYRENTASEIIGNKSDFITSYVPLSFGIEANFLYDFWEKGEQVLGASIGIGYSFVYGINTKINLPNEPRSDSMFKDFTDKNIYYSLISPKIALHYYYGKHQVELGFSFDKALGESVNKNSINLGSTYYIGENTITTKPNYFYTFSLSYAYRF